MTSLDTIDVFDQERYLDGPPYADFAVLRRQAPVFHHRDPEVPEGHWAITRHADIVHVARHPELFSSEQKGAQPQEFDEVAIDVQRRTMDLATRCPTPSPGSYRSGRAELDVVCRPTRRDRAVIGLPSERERTR